MRWLRNFALLTVMLVSCHGFPKSSEGIKRAVDSYTYPDSTTRFQSENPDNSKTKVIVETIKSISPSEYLTSEGFIGTTFEANTPTGKVPVGSVSFQAFEPEPTKKEPTPSSIPAETPSPAKKKTTFRFYTGSSTSAFGSSTTNSQFSSAALQTSSTLPPAPVRTSSAEPITTVVPTYQYTSRLTGSASDSLSAKPSKNIISRGKSRHSTQKIVKKSAKLEAKIDDSRPEETGFNGYHYDVGSLSFESKHSGSAGGGGGGAGGMMGASYMRSSSPYYNFHVMLD